MRPLAILASSAIRYFMIRFNLQQIITLDMDEVLRPNGDTGVYIQYAYARANSILRRLQEAGYTMPRSSLTQLPSSTGDRASGICCAISMSIRAVWPKLPNNWHHHCWPPMSMIWPRILAISMSTHRPS